MKRTRCNGLANVGEGRNRPVPTGFSGKNYPIRRAAQALPGPNRSGLHHRRLLAILLAIAEPNRVTELRAEQNRAFMREGIKSSRLAATVFVGCEAIALGATMEWVFPALSGDTHHRIRARPGAA